MKRLGKQKLPVVLLERIHRLRCSFTATKTHGQMSLHSFVNIEESLHLRGLGALRIFFHLPPAENRSMMSEQQSALHRGSSAPFLLVLLMNSTDFSRPLFSHFLRARTT